MNCSKPKRGMDSNKAHHSGAMSLVHPPHTSHSQNPLNASLAVELRKNYLIHCVMGCASKGTQFSCSQRQITPTPHTNLSLHHYTTRNSQNMKLFSVLTVAITANDVSTGLFSFQKKIGHNNNLRNGVRNLQEEPDLVVVGNDGSPSSSFPLQLCQGDCDTDDDCTVSQQWYYIIICTLTFSLSLSPISFSIVLTQT